MASFPDVQRAGLRSVDAEAVRARLLAVSPTRLAAVSTAAGEADTAHLELATLQGATSASHRMPTLPTGVAALPRAAAVGSRRAPLDSRGSVA